LRDSLQSTIEDEQQTTTARRWPVQISKSSDEQEKSDTILVATEPIPEGSEILVEKSFLVAPWPTQQEVNHHHHHHYHHHPNVGNLVS